MVRRATGVILGLALLRAGTLAAQTSTQGEEDVRSAAQFVKGLSDKGYQDLAAEYLEQVRSHPALPADVRETIDYEIGRMLLDEAKSIGDLGRRRELIDKSRTRFESFTKANPEHALAADALVQLGKLMVIRANDAKAIADDTDVKADRDAKLVESRAAFDQAREVYEAAVKRLQAAYAKFSSRPDDPRRDEREKTQNALLQAMLERALVDYQQGETYALKTTERNELMTKALKQFEALSQKHRTQMSGIAARMWQGKCYEERGDIGPAMGIYNELLEHQAPQLRPLQRVVGYFKIIALGKRKEYALAADTADSWLKDVGNSPAALRQPEVIGVQFELVKDLLAQFPTASESEKANATKRVIELLGKVVRYPSPYKAEAIELLRKYKPKAAENALDIARLNYDDAIGVANEAVAAREWDRAATIYKQAIRKAEAVRDADKLTFSRYHLAFCYYMSKRYYEAAVLGDHLARRYPRASLAPKAANIGLFALRESFQSPDQVDAQSDLKNMIELAEYTAEAFPDQEEGDIAKLLLGSVYQSTQQFDKALKVFDSVRPKSHTYADAQTRAGATHWWLSQALRRSGKNTEADAEAAKALSTLQAALKVRQDTGEAQTDSGFIGNACEIAEVYLETSRPAEALKLLEPIAKAQTSATGPDYFKLTSALFRSHAALNQIDLALADMAAIEKSGETGSSLTKLYVDLGKALEKEIESRDAKGDKLGRDRAQQALLRFLTTLSTSKSGQTYSSLLWTGKKMLDLEDAKGAEAVFQRIIDTFGKDPRYVESENASDHVLVWKLGLAQAYRLESKFDEAEKLVNEVIAQNPKRIDPLMEKGKLMETMAESKQLKWSEATKHWRLLATRLEGVRPRPSQYYEAWYHAALAMNHEGKGKEARQALGGIMRLSPKVGSPEMKKKYEALLAQIKS